MKSKKSKPASDLFAVLLRDEYVARLGVWALTARPVEHPANYLSFLRTQADYGNKCCPYARAVRLIEGRA